VKVINASKNTVLATNALLADSFFSRAVGLLHRKGLEADEALILTRCQSIHMFFMRFAIDVIFADKDNRVVGLTPHIKPYQMSPIFFKASYAVELPVGTIQRSQTTVGDRLEIKED